MLLPASLLEKGEKIWNVSTWLQSYLQGVTRRQQQTYLTLLFSISLSSMLKTAVVVLWSTIRQKRKTREKCVNVVRHKVTVDIDRKREKVGLGGAGGRGRGGSVESDADDDGAGVESSARMWQLSKRASLGRNWLHESHPFGGLCRCRAGLAQATTDRVGHHHKGQDSLDCSALGAEVTRSGGADRCLAGWTCGLLLLPPFLPCSSRTRDLVSLENLFLPCRRREAEVYVVSGPLTFSRLLEEWNGASSMSNGN